MYLFHYQRMSILIEFQFLPLRLASCLLWSKEKPIQLSEVLCLWVIDGNPVSGVSCYEQSPIRGFPKFYEFGTLKIAAVLLGFVVQLFVIGTTVLLIKNMALPKWAS